MAERKFKAGDLVKSTSTGGPYEHLIQDKICVFKRYWDGRYTLRNACDVTCPGVTDLYGREEIAQSADDLELVTIERPENDLDPFDWVVNGQLMRVRSVWQTCGHKETRHAQYRRCMRCYPPSEKVYASHGPYYYGYYRDTQGKQRRVYIGRELPPQGEGKEA